MSNKAAVGLYVEDGYDVADIIPLYYGDGEDAYFMRKDLLSVGGEEALKMERKMEQKLQPEQQQQKLRRGEKERNEWLNRDATRNGSFFDNRKSMRDTLSQEEKAWVNKTTNPPVSAMASSSPTLTGQFKRSFRTFFNSGGEQPMQQQSQRQSQYQLPPWETGPEGLRLPRYSKVMRASPETAAATAVVEKSLNRGMSLKNLVVTVANKQKEEEDGFTESYEEEEEDSLSLDNACAASGSV